MSNGAAIVARVAVKPVSTLRKPLDAVDLETGEVRRAHIERSDVAILPRAAVVGEAMLALALADALLADLGGDTIGDLRAAVRRRRARSMGPRGRRNSVGDGLVQPPGDGRRGGHATGRPGRLMSVVPSSGPAVADGLTFRLLGPGIAYSASPAMMTAAFAALGLPHRYVLADVAPEAVPGHGGQRCAAPTPVAPT